VNYALIVAGREFRQIAGMRSFWLTLLIIPMSLAVGILTPKLIQKDDPDQVMVIDHAGGGVARAIEQQFALDRDRNVLTALARYVQHHRLESADPQALWSKHDRWFSDQDVARFVAAGGIHAATAKIARVKPKGTSDFTPPKPDYELVPVPPSLTAMPDPRLDTLLKEVLKPTDKSTRPVDYVILVPAGFGANPLVRLWANRQPSPQFVSRIQDVLTSDLRG